MALDSDSDSGVMGADRRITAFICINAARDALAPSDTPRRPKAPDFEWPFSVEEIHVPCTGALQPEYLLKTIEAGADLVCVVACQEDNCHRLEGSCRAARRVGYVGRLLDETGLGADRVMLMHLPGSSRQDMALGSGLEAPAFGDALREELRSVRDQVVERLGSLTRNPLRQAELPSTV